MRAFFSAAIALSRTPVLQSLKTTSPCIQGRLDVGVDLLSKPSCRAGRSRKIRHILNNQRQGRPAPALTWPSGGTEGPLTPLTILLVEDDPVIHMTLAWTLLGLGHPVLEAESGR